MAGSVGPAAGLEISKARAATVEYNRRSCLKYCQWLFVSTMRRRRDIPTGLEKAKNISVNWLDSRGPAAQVFFACHNWQDLGSIDLMKKMNVRMKNQNITLTSIILALSCFSFLPQMLAVSPPPDGCYPGLTTAEGCFALFSLTSGTGNTAIGQDALFSDTTGSWNTGVGAVALGLNNGDFNSAVGVAALLLNTGGTGNSALGAAALVNNNIGANNTGVGSFALQNNIQGSNNTAVGNAALQNSVGDFNIALGVNAGTDPDIISNNVYIGDPGFPDDTNVISIGGIAASGTPYELTFIGGIFGSEVNTGTALPVYVDTDGHLGTTLVNASRQKLRIRGFQGAQHQATLNEFQKQQKRIAELENTVARLAAIVKDQSAQIEKVSAQLELRKPVRRVVTNKQ